MLHTERNAPPYQIVVPPGTLLLHWPRLSTHKAWEGTSETLVPLPQQKAVPLPCLPEEPRGLSLLISYRHVYVMEQGYLQNQSCKGVWENAVFSFITPSMKKKCSGFAVMVHEPFCMSVTFHSMGCSTHHTYSASSI